MPQHVFSVALARPGGPPVTVVLVDASFGRLGAAGQARLRSQIVAAAHGAGFAGEVALAWPLDGDRVACVGPPAHRGAVEALGFRRLAALVNKKLVCAF